MSKSLRRHICYVLQNDVFFANLTLRQTLEYTAMLRLPDRVGRPEKMRKVDEVIAALDLESCEQIPVGDFGLAGLSGGQKKRLSIACELLSNPAVMLLDEPTSSLDSCTALNLVKLLRDYALREQKTIVMSIHQPSSQIFHMFDKLLLLARGQMLYFGSPRRAMPFFAHFAHRPDPELAYNPADYLLEVSKQMDGRELQRISLAARSTFHANYKAAQQCSSLAMTMTTGCQCSVKSSSGSSTLSCSGSTNSTRNLHSPGSSHRHHQHHQQHHESGHKQPAAARISHSFVGPPTPSPPPPQPTNQSNQQQDAASYYANHTNHHHQNLIFESASIHGSMSKIYIHEHDFDCASSSAGIDDFEQLEHPSSATTHGSTGQMSPTTSTKRPRHEWPSSFYTQVCALTSRNFIECRARALSKLNWIQTIGIALISGSMWFQLGRNEDSLEDVKGWIYFSTTYWMMVSLFSTLATIPQESQVISKERLGGYYRLSAYYVAKMIAELPLIVALPTVYHLISYPMLGLYSMQTFFIMWLMVILNSIAAQSVGILIGYSFKRIDVSLVVASLYSTSTMLFAGFYAKNIPACLAWYRFLSLIYYGFLNMQLIEYTTGPPVACATKNSKFPSCNKDDQHALQTTASLTATSGNINDLISTKNTTQFTKYVDSSELLWGIDRFRPTDEPTPLWFNTLCLITFLFVFRLLGYLVLRSYHKPT